PLFREDVRGPRALLHLRVALADDLAHLQRHLPCVVVAAFTEAVCKVRDVGGAVGRGETGPGAEGDAGLFDGGSDLRYGRNRMGRERLPGRGIDDGDRTTSRARLLR